MRKVILRSVLSLGDAVVMSAAVRDLHILHPGKFITDVDTSCMEIWENNPFITKLDKNDPEVEVIECHYPLINQSNQLPYHFIHGYHQFIFNKLNVPIHPTDFRGDIYLSTEERKWMSQVSEKTGNTKPFWLIVAGGKYDYTCKWWDPKRSQEVVDYFAGKIQFVQVGDQSHNHPKLNNVVDLVGKTSIRELVRLVYHSQGIICPVTSMMHLAAAVPANPEFTPENRPCVVIAGGREPMQWEAYPTHQFIHTIGALSCCARGGCWKARVKPLGDGDDKDKPENLCSNVIGDLPKCMDMITSEQVIQRIELYFQGGITQYIK